MKAKFNITENVYFKNDPEQLEYVITGYIVRVNSIAYYLCNSGNEKVVRF